MVLFFISIIGISSIVFKGIIMKKFVHNSVQITDGPKSSKKTL